MKFNCDYFPNLIRVALLRLDYWRARREYRKYMKIEKNEKWHKVFAFLPRKVADGDCRWLEYIERRRVKRGTYLSLFLEWKTSFKWQYRAIQKQNPESL